MKAYFTKQPVGAHSDAEILCSFALLMDKIPHVADARPCGLLGDRHDSCLNLLATQKFAYSMAAPQAQQNSRAGGLGT